MLTAEQVKRVELIGAAGVGIRSRRREIPRITPDRHPADEADIRSYVSDDFGRRVRRIDGQQCVLDAVETDEHPVASPGHRVDVVLGIAVHADRTDDGTLARVEVDREELRLRRRAAVGAVDCFVFVRGEDQRPIKDKTNVQLADCRRREIDRVDLVEFRLGIEAGGKAVQRPVRRELEAAEAVDPGAAEERQRDVRR